MIRYRPGSYFNDYSVSIMWKFLFGCLLLLSLSSHAAQMDGLFQAQVDSAGRDEAAREAAMVVALDEVLLRLTGSRAALQSKAAAGLRASPGRFVEQFRFIEPAADSDAGLQLWVQFDGVSLARELRAAGLPYWGQERPDLLAWLAVDAGGQRYLISEGAGGIAQATRAAARRHGLPLTLPLQDLEDQRSVQFTDVWGGFNDAILNASERYRAQVVLTGKLDGSATHGWRGDWRMLNGGIWQRWTTHATTLPALIDSGMADAGSRLAQRYAVVAGQEGELGLVVEGVRSLEDFGRLSAYLEGLSLVDKVSVVRVQEEEVEFMLQLGTDQRSLWQLISLGKTLQPLAGENHWRFQLNL